MPQGYVTFAGLGPDIIIGGEMTLSRGALPSTCLLRMIPRATFDRVIGTLQFTYGGSQITFANCAAVENSFRAWHGRDGWRWSIQVMDRRWKWRYPRITGIFNERACDNKLQIANKKSVRELASILLSEMDESADVSALPSDVYPRVYWDRAVAAHELEWLCDLVGCVLFLDSDDTVRIKKLNQGAGLPAGGVEVTPLGHSWKPAVIPQNLRVQGGPDITQDAVAMKAVGLDTDARIHSMGSVSWWGGWGTQHYDHFADVAISKRHFAFQTCSKWFAPVDDGIELLGDSAETGLDEGNIRRCAPPQIRGIFWPQCHHKINTPDGVFYADEFETDRHLNVVKFEHPVVKWTGGNLDFPVLYYVGAWRKRTDNRYPAYTRDLAVNKSNFTTKHRILQHPELVKVTIDEALYGSPPGNNTATLNPEADSYLSSVEATYDFENATDVAYDGLQKFALDGSRAQIKWWCGHGRPALTRLGLHTEFDVHTKAHAARRRHVRMIQIAERMVL